MIADLVNEFRVHVNHVVIERAGKEVVAHQNMVERLRVAIELVSVSLTLGQRLDQGMQDPTFERVDGRGKVEVVQVAEDDDLRAGV